MKKSVISFMLLLLAIGGMKAQEVTVADVEALPGETVSFSVNLSNGKADTYTSLQFDLGLPTGITTTGSPTFSASWPGATGVVSAKGAFASAEVMAGSDIEGLVSVSLKVDDGMEYGSYDVTLSNIQFRYGTEGAHDDAPDVTFKVNVVSMHSTILDENSTVAPTPATGVNVLVRRTINANEWSTICLPFAMSEEQVKAAFGNSVRLADFNSWSSEEDNDGDIVHLSIGFADATAIEANHPYVIKVTEAISEFSVTGVDIVVEDEPTVQVGKKKAERGYFIGSYVANTLIPENCLFLNGNKFWYSKGLTKMKAFRAYFELADVLTAVEEADARITMLFEDNETTGIDVRSKKKAARSEIYDLQGRKIQKPVKGLYIKNGRKELIR